MKKFKSFNLIAGLLIGISVISCNVFQNQIHLNSGKVGDNLSLEQRKLFYTLGFNQDSLFRKALFYVGEDTTKLSSCVVSLKRDFRMSDVDINSIDAARWPMYRFADYLEKGKVVDNKKLELLLKDCIKGIRAIGEYPIFSKKEKSYMCYKYQCALDSLEKSQNTAQALKSLINFDPNKANKSLAGDNNEPMNKREEIISKKEEGVEKEVDMNNKVKAYVQEGMTYEQALQLSYNEMDFENSNKNNNNLSSKLNVNEEEQYINGLYAKNKIEKIKTYMKDLNLSEYEATLIVEQEGLINKNKNKKIKKPTNPVNQPNGKKKEEKYIVSIYNQAKIDKIKAYERTLGISNYEATIIVEQEELINKNKEIKKLFDFGCENNIQKNQTDEHINVIEFGLERKDAKRFKELKSKYNLDDYWSIASMVYQELDANRKLY